ncbi:hypothetical protein BGZ73_002848, partial [Actinomortierella ambigua]
MTIQWFAPSATKRITGWIMKLCKRKFHLPSNTPNAIMAHHRLGGVRLIEDLQAEEQIPSLHSRLNDTGLIGQLTRERVLALWARSGTAAEPTVTPSEVKTYRHCLTSHI